ncbi:MAG: Mrp/NBP35 family ATP-binding protein [Acidimicrobiia bacterium]
MVNEGAVSAAVASVIDPELGRSLGELGMVRDVRIGDGGNVGITVALTVPGCPYQDELEADVVAAAGSAAEVGAVSVTFTVMSDEERARVVHHVRGERDGGVMVGGPGSRTRIVAVSSGKGGVGKSSVTTNLGVTLAAAGHRVGIIDADVWGFSIPKMLGIERGPTVVDRLLLPPAAHGVRVMSMDYFVGADQAIIWRGPMLHKALEQFLSDVHWDEPDFLLIDMPPGTGDVAISISQFLPRAQALIVTTPQTTAQRVAKRAALMARKVDQEVLGVVENMSWFIGDDGVRYAVFGEGGGAALAAELDVPLLAQIPLVSEVGRGADAGVPAVDVAADSEVVVAFEKLATEIVARKPRVRSHPELTVQ